MLFRHSGGGGLQELERRAFGDGAQVGEDANFSIQFVSVNLRPEGIIFSLVMASLKTGHYIGLLAGGGGFSLVVATAAVAVDFFFTDGAPGPAIAREQFFGFDRAPGTGSVIWKASRGQRVPDVDDRLNHVPPGLDHVESLEERGIAGHAIAQEPLVSG